MANPPVDLAQLAASVQQQTTAIANFTDQQILLYTTTDPTVTVTDANGNPIVIPSYNATIGANAAAVSAMQAQVDANTAAIAAIDTGDTTINSNITALQNQQATNTANIATNTTAIANIQSKQTTDESNITTLQSQVASLQASNGTQSADFTALQNQVDTNTTTISSIQSQQTTNTNSIASLQTSVTNNTSAISSLQTNTTTNTNNISTNTTALTTLQGQVSSIQTQQNTDVTNIAANAANITTNTSAITTLNNSVGSINTSITTLQSGQTDLQTQINNNDATISTVQSDVSNLSTKESTDFTTATTSITALQNTVNSLPAVGKYDPPFVNGRFYTHVFMDVDGRLLGGISRKSGKLWMNNGGWVTERLDKLEYTVDTTTLSYWGGTTSINPPTIPRYGQIFGSVIQNSDGSDGNQLCEVYGGITAGGRDLEVRDTTGKIRSFNALRNRVISNLPSDDLIVNKSTGLVLSDSTLTGITDSHVSVTNVIPTQTSTQLAARFAATPVLLSVTGRKILASGATTVTASQILDGSGTLQTVYPITSDSPSQSIVGSLDGIMGTLTRGASDSALTFTPTVTLSADHYIPDATPFIPQDSKRSLSQVLIIAVGRNNITDLPTIKRDIQAIVNAIPTSEKCFIIVSPYNWVGEDNTTANGQAIIALEQWIAFNYPNNCVLSRQELQNTYAALGAGDASTYFGNGLVPASYLQGDGKTLTTTAVGYLHGYIFQMYASKGWLI